MIKTQLRRREAVGDVQLSAQLHPLLRRLYALRGVSEERELERSVKGMPDSISLTGSVTFWLYKSIILSGRLP